ncbi:coiled-coil domain-containing protein 93 isoform X2 [Sitophilus oryzae]|uniref:Coiled-coil domain-containing protein 93 n=1 Tax=Sitophilus oryzae TaxID=7048 RepID=A0A6J2XMF2_SITOR|nr:coiled-coil domain-containing protein 93 isoform X2 [Sitophilus oryzae]
MASINQDMFNKFQQVSKRQQKNNGEIKVEVREDEEQFTKLQEIIDLLVAAGYFRARIKGLSPFDKIVGGMVWCVESLDVDVDVNLLFEENSTIGQKIALTEKIVIVLPKIKCPHRIEPHQIQGLDCIHIFPVIQWLVKASLDAREEKSAFVRSYAVKQFQKTFSIKEKTDKKLDQMLDSLKIVNEAYRPTRYYKRKNVPPPDILSRVQITLLEYGYRGGSILKSVTDSTNNGEGSSEQTNSFDEEQDIIKDDTLSEEDKEMLIKHYASMHSELKDGGHQAKETQQLNLLEEQTQLLDNNILKLQATKTELEEQLQQQRKILEDTKIKQLETNQRLKEFEEEKSANLDGIKEIEELVILKDTLKSEETQFKEKCKQELARLQKEIDEFKQVISPTETSPRMLADIAELTDKIKLLRLNLAKKNQIVAKLQRQLDDVPNRAEMNQYQKRFLELYNQVAAKHKETKQYYTLYNTLEDKRRYMQKELSIMNSISDNYPEAMQSSSSKEEFMTQFKNIVDGVKQNRLKIERQVYEQRKKKDQLNSVLQGLLELQRTYAAGVKQLTLECAKYETLLAGKGSER